MGGNDSVRFGAGVFVGMVVYALAFVVVFARQQALEQGLSGGVESCGGCHVFFNPRVKVTSAPNTRSACSPSVAVFVGRRHPAGAFSSERSPRASRSSIDSVPDRFVVVERA